MSDQLTELPYHEARLLRCLVAAADAEFNLAAVRQACPGPYESCARKHVADSLAALGMLEIVTERPRRYRLTDAGRSQGDVEHQRYADWLDAKGRKPLNSPSGFHARSAAEFKTDSMRRHQTVSRRGFDISDATLARAVVLGIVALAAWFLFLILRRYF